MPVVRAAAAMSGAAKRRRELKARSKRRAEAAKAARVAAGEEEEEEEEEEELEHVGCFGSDRHNAVAQFFVRIRDAKWFQTSIIGIIFLAGILVGIQTYNVTDPTTLVVIDTLDTIVLIVFILEIVVKFIAEGKKPFRFFKDAWNVFDFLIVVVGMMPFGGSAVTALRLVRLLRVLKLVRALPKLRILVMGLLKSLSSIAYIGLLLMLLFYLYAVLGVSVFGANDPMLMGTLHIAFLTLFRCATLEDWTDVMYTAMEGCENYGYGDNMDQCTSSKAQPLVAVIYFCSFVILSSMMILNLFIGVITSSMQDAKSDLSDEAEGKLPDNHDEEVEKKLGEYADLVQELLKDVSDWAVKERDNNPAAIVTLSSRSILANRETTKPMALLSQSAVGGPLHVITGSEPINLHKSAPPPLSAQVEEADDAEAAHGKRRSAAVAPAPGPGPATAASLAAALAASTTAAAATGIERRGGAAQVGRGAGSGAGSANTIEEEDEESDDSSDPGERSVSTVNSRTELILS